MRIARWLPALILSAFFSIPAVRAQSPRTLSDLPTEARAKIRAAFSHRGGSFPVAEAYNAPTEGPWAQLTQPVQSADQNGLYFGTSVAISGNIVVIGETYTFGGNRIGEALVFSKPANNNWNNLTQVAVLVPSDGLGNDLFAISVAISGNTIVVGSTTCYTCGTGRAYVYVEPTDGWSGTLTQTAELTASDGVDNEQLGTSVSISGKTVLVGAPGIGAGAAYLYVEPQGGWVNMTQTAKLTASDGSSGDQLGISVSISGNTAVAGAPGNASQSGAAYVFGEPAGGWVDMTQTAKLVASGAGGSAQLGQSVAIEDSIIVAGALSADGRSLKTGAGYVYEKPADGWKNATQSATLLAPDGRPEDEFGSAVAISGNTIAIGAPERSPGPLSSRGYPAWWRSGATYVFTASGVGWIQTSAQVLTGSDAHDDDLLGSSVAVDNDLVVTGAPYVGKGLGGAFVFIRTSE